MRPQLNMRKNTCKLLEMMDEGLIAPKTVAEMALQWLSDDDVGDMMDANEISDRFMEEEEEE
jgi:hypothetical protein